MTDDLRKWRAALFVFFFIPGITISSWVTRTPAIRDGIEASLAQMGLVLLGLSAGSMSGLLMAGAAVGRFGTRRITFIGMWLIIVGMFVLASGVAIGLAPLVALGLALFGFGMGGCEIAINVDGAKVEQASGRTLMHALHGCFSLGTVVGALFGFGMAALQVPVVWHLCLVTALSIAPIVVCMRWIPEGTGLTRTTGTDEDRSVADDTYWKDLQVYLIGIVVLAVALAEGAANDWLPILMVDEHGFSPAIGGLVFVGFASAMTVGRFSGGYFLERFGPAAVIRGSAVLCGLGLAAVIFAPVPELAAVSVVLWGLGTSLGFPVAISAAGASGGNTTGRVRVVTFCGYIAFLVGPPFLGLLGELYGLRSAMLVVFGLIVMAGIVAPALRPRRLSAVA
ncbi:MFS transporter [Pelagovum pacificum]|uniref:MFS transporter n=1 Tax=Pelagovum pacificum TaxID=2588711 RepID=A0A5C5GB89_9RHOB|nr:MFS transporter [Pelagovum pacificum]QQA41285.1 MFS transporter [Pelagovum pacificum]TNY31908.1 MFS transporter [Pelagovum pacificum]